MNAVLNDIMLVDDEPDIRMIAELALAGVGPFSVRCFDGGQQACQAFEVQPPQLLLLDVMMPEMDGPHTLKAIRALDAGQSLPIIFMTAKSQPHEIQELLALGAIGVISKPFEPMTLAEQVQQLWDNQHG